MLWKGPFVPLGNAQVESKFADHRTYFYQGKEVDQQVHLGFDLAVTANIPVKAGNDGKVVYADYFGIYGNCVSSTTAWASARSTATWRRSTSRPATP